MLLCALWYFRCSNGNGVDPRVEKRRKVLLISRTLPLPRWHTTLYAEKNKHNNDYQSKTRPPLIRPGKENPYTKH